ncbi:MAG: 30S ribosomal protein S9 [Spirochaetales bacterium]|nr:30S ribosomal protein S9 [Leptospiraceae bacterium]MCP5483525.1 30S ribosomal protein S9 [Spirochaetales bacterium]MCP5486723.1 30S ribosomal protein S9 [Spirochaetales bacterium]
MSQSTFTIGRRKTAIARVKLTPGDGKIEINGRNVDEYFPVLRLRNMAMQGLTLVGMQGKCNLKISVVGGGIKGQAGAVRLGIARALQEQNKDLRAPLKKDGQLKRDPRMVERKKYGLHKARRGTQFSKR